jgi:hypothetical protein
VVAVAAGGAILGLRVLAGHLPPSALWPVEPAGPVGTVGTVTPVAPAAGHLEGLAA